MPPSRSTEQPAPIPLRVLIVEDRETDTELIVRELKKHGFDPSWVRVDTEADFLAQIHNPFDLVTADAIMPQFSAMRAIYLLQEHQLEIPCIVISGSIGEEDAVALIRAGASDYLMKDRLGRLGQSIHHVLDQRRLRADNRQTHKALVTLNEELERRIAERTVKLEEVNQQLAQELTERKQIEERLRRNEATLERRVATRTAQLERSHTRLRSLVSELTLTEQRERKQLASELHDYLAQLLVVSKLKVHQLRRNLSDSTNERLLKETEEALDQALTYSRTLVARLSPTVLFTQGLIPALHWLAEVFSTQGLRVDVQCHIDAIPLPEDHAVLVFQSVRELLFNALKHAGTNEATLEVLVHEEHILHIAVFDDGAGFDEKTLSRTTTGYGLFSIQERIEGLGGSFSVRSSPGSGTRIEMSVPIPAMAETSNRSHEARLTDDSAPTLPTPTTCRVMVVDDHALVRQELAKLATSIRGVTVVGEASNGYAGVEMAGTLAPDLVLMDVNMPGIDGIEATRRILVQNPRIKVIGVTVNTDAEIHARMIAAGAVVSLNKDTLARDLKPTISRILRRDTISPSA